MGMPELSFAWGSKKQKKETSQMSQSSTPKSADSVSRQLLVRFTDENAFNNRQEILKKHNLKELDVVRAGKLVSVEIPKDAAIDTLMKTLKEEENIKYAEPNFKVSI
jgi:hypothetical protein